MEQIIKFGISNYLLLCVEAGFSQIQSHIYISKQCSYKLPLVPKNLYKRGSTVTCLLRFAKALPVNLNLPKIYVANFSQLTRMITFIHVINP